VSSSPDSNRSWGAAFDDQGSESNIGIVVAICATSDSLGNYSVQNGFK
jgi:hypothetical protein